MTVDEFFTSQAVAYTLLIIAFILLGVFAVVADKTYKTRSRTSKKSH